MDYDDLLDDKANALQHSKATKISTGSNVPHICLTSVRECQISSCFVV